jgi:hypothetical protein
VELITAASLMTLMMMGVVQIFAIITETASEAQGNAFAMEQGRALLDSIHRDIRGFDRGGYFKIQKWDTKEDGTTETTATVKTPPSTRPNPGIPIFNGTNAVTWYSSDCLALTSVGYWEGQKGSATPRRTLGAEVVYTANVKTPATRLEITSGHRMDPRRGLLARGVWVVDPTPPVPSTANDGLNASDRSRGATLIDLGSGKAIDRLSIPDGTQAGAASPIVVAPLSDAKGWNTAAAEVWQVRRVAASCTSEFLVETLEMPLTGVLPTWTRRPWTVVPISGTTTSTDRECPRAIRVTVAAHDPNDKTPRTGPSMRYEGYALQEIFWISDP